MNGVAEVLELELARAALVGAGALTFLVDCCSVFSTGSLSGALSLFLLLAILSSVAGWDYNEEVGGRTMLKKGSG